MEKFYKEGTLPSDTPLPHPSDTQTAMAKINANGPTWDYPCFGPSHLRCWYWGHGYLLQGLLPKGEIRVCILQYIISINQHMIFVIHILYIYIHLYIYIYYIYIYIFLLARFKIGARSLCKMSDIYGTVRFVRVLSLVRTGGTVRLVRLVRLVRYGWYALYSTKRTNRTKPTVPGL